MKYLGKPDYQHGTGEKLGILMVNLGTPDAPDTKSVRRYLKQFLSDPRIIELPRLLWLAILHGVILRVRPAKSAQAYQEVWNEQSGSPLMSISCAQANALQTNLQARFGPDVIVSLGMRYGSPSVDKAISELESHNVRRMLVLPMYPQYSGTTVASVFDEVATRLQRTRWIPELRFITQFCNEPDYIKALASSVRESWNQHGRGDLLVTSYHGIPKRYLLNGDPYHCLCHKTTRLLADELGLTESDYRVVFQSRVGKEEWLTPYCDETMKTLPTEGIKSIDVISPAFSADCLETLEEIEGENKDYFIEHGGLRFQYIACLNDRADHMEMLCDLVEKHCQGWPEVSKTRDLDAEAAHWNKSKRLATNLIDRKS